MHGTCLCSRFGGSVRRGSSGCCRAVLLCCLSSRESADGAIVFRPGRGQQCLRARPPPATATTRTSGSSAATRWRRCAAPPPRATTALVRRGRRPAVPTGRPPGGGVVVFDDPSALWCSVGRDARQSRPAITPRALWPNWIEPDHPDRRSQEPAAATMASHMTDSNVRPEPLPNRAVSAHGDAIVLIPRWDAQLSSPMAPVNMRSGHRTLDGSIRRRPPYSHLQPRTNRPPGLGRRFQSGRPRRPRQR